MCLGCWEEAGFPKIDNAQVRRAGELGGPIDGYGGCHIVRADWNLDDGSLDFCHSYKTTTDAERVWLDLMRNLSEDERHSAMAIADGFWTPPPTSPSRQPGE